MATKNKNPENTQYGDCFVIMPIAHVEGYDETHFDKVYEDIFKIACTTAGYRPIRADEVKQTNLIHLDILQKLIESPMAICDLSSRNPNVLFELGLRQAFDKPTVLVQECDTPKIFDISPLRYTTYRRELSYREVLEDQNLIADAITATREDSETGQGINSLIHLLSLSSPAKLREVSDNDTTTMLQVIMSEMNDLRADFKRSMRRIDERNAFFPSRTLEQLDLEYNRARQLVLRVKDLYNSSAATEVIFPAFTQARDAIFSLRHNKRIPAAMEHGLQRMLADIEDMATNLGPPTLN